MAQENWQAITASRQANSLKTYILQTGSWQTIEKASNQFTVKNSKTNIWHTKNWQTTKRVTTSWQAVTKLLQLKYNKKSGYQNLPKNAGDQEASNQM